ncbi:MAG: methyltransferase domain-containing protein, partial [Candidatus Eisenbacteria bacterium]|nr:methyltransferase domain-containing protein [Candidatus Eisenbacteria bacterium]
AGKTDREILRQALADNNVETVAGEHSKLALRVKGNIVLKGISEFEIGHFFVQDESETLVVELLDPQPGETILDLCAAPGGKTCHIQEARGSEGHVIAVDVQAKRLSRINENLERMQLKNVSVVGADGIDLALAEKVDRVLVDAPCSGLGVLARRADARWRKTPESVRALVPLQQKLLQAAAKHVKPGGVLVYSVCSFEPEEGIEQVKAFLAQDSSFILEDAGQWLPETVVTDGYLTMLPHRHGTDGAFAARLKKQ